MKRSPLAIICELGCEDRFDILRIGRKDEPFAREGYFDCFGVRVGGPAEEPVPEGEVGPADGAVDGSDDDVDAEGEEGPNDGGVVTQPAYADVFEDK